MDAVRAGRSTQLDFQATAEQRAVTESFGRFFTKESGAERVRAAEPLGFDAELWQQLTALGAVAIAIPESVGGAGAGLSELALVCEEQGRHVAAVPLVEVATAARLLSALGATDLVTPALDGLTLVTLALRPAAGGVSHFVPAGAVAEIAVGLDGDELVACGPPPSGCARPMATLASAPVADRALSGPAAGPRRVLAKGAEAAAAFARARDEWLLLTAATLVGVAQGAIDLAVAYVKERKQFGVAIGSFQTIAHRLADVATAIDGARLLTYEAAWACDNDADPTGSRAAMAFGFAVETAQRSAAESLHFHGGYGFMLEYDIQLYYRRAKAWALVYDDPKVVYQRIGAAQAAD